MQSPVGPHPPAVIVKVSKTEMKGAVQLVADPVLSAVEAPLKMILQSNVLQSKVTFTEPPQPLPTPAQTVPFQFSCTTPRGAVPPEKWA